MMVVTISNKTAAELAATPPKIYRNSVGKEIKPPYALSSVWGSYNRKM